MLSGRYRVRLLYMVVDYRSLTLHDQHTGYPQIKQIKFFVYVHIIIIIIISCTCSNLNKIIQAGKSICLDERSVLSENQAADAEVKQYNGING